MQAKMNVVVSSSKNSMNSLISLLEQNIPTTFFKTHVGKLKIYNEKYHCNKQQTLTLHQQKKINGQVFNVINSDLRSICILKTNKEGIQSHMNYNSKKYNLSHIEMTSTKWIYNNTLPSSKVERILYSNISPNVKDVNEKQPEDRKSPKEHLSNVFKHLQRDVCFYYTKKLH